MPTRRLALTLVAMLAVGVAAYGAFRSSACRPAAEPAAAHPAARPNLIEAAFDGRRDWVDDSLADWLRQSKPGDGHRLLAEYGSLAARAYAVLGEPGLTMLPATAAMPSFRQFLDSPVALAASASLQPIAAHLGEMVSLDPARAETVFHTFTRLGEREGRLLAEHPQALPILSVAPTPGAEVIERFGEAAVSLMLRFTPDSYPFLAQVLATDGERVFAMRDLLLGEGRDLVADRQDALESFLVLYFVEHGELTPWLERHLGFEQAAFFVSNNAEFLHEAARRHGSETVKTSLSSLTQYARAAQDDVRHAVADACFSVPGAFPIFVELRQVPSARDRFLAAYANKGGAGLLAMGYDASLWRALVEAVDDARQTHGAAGGDSLMVLLTVLAEHEPFHNALRRTLAASPGALTVAQTLHALLAAMQDDGGPDAPQFRMVARTLQMILDGNVDDIPDDYLSRQVDWIWTVLPGRDALRLVRLTINGYSPTLWEQVNGVWDGINVVRFGLSVGGSLVDATANVARAIGEQSVSGLARALGMVATASAGDVVARLIGTLREPRNFVRLALTSGYFVYDAFLTYAPFEIPFRADLLEINQKYLDASMREMFVRVVRDVGVRAVLWRPEFDRRDWEPTPPDAPENWDGLGQAGRVAFVLDRLDYRVKRAVVDLLNANEQRRNFAHMLGLAGAAGEEPWRYDESVQPRGPEAFGDADRAPAERDGERESRYRPSAREQDDSHEIRAPGAFSLPPVAYVIEGGERRPVQMPRLRNLVAGERTSTIGGWSINVPRNIDAWHEFALREPRFVSWTLEWIADMATPARG